MRTNSLRLTALTAVTLLAATATACGGRGDDGGTTAADGPCQGQQTTGVTDDTIKLGGIYPLSGPVSAYGEIPKGTKAFFDYVNAEKGGINGRKVEFIMRDDGYQPPRSVEEARQLVEQEKVFALFQTLGTPTSSAVMEYANQQQVPHVFVSSGATKWGEDPEGAPWTIGWQPSYHSEGRVYAHYLDEEYPDATVAILYQNDDYGKDVRDGFLSGLEGTGVTVIAEQTYEATDPSVDPQMRNLAKSGADVFFNITTPKFGTQALAADAKNTSWNPLHIINNVASSTTVLEPVGFDKVEGIISAAFLKDPADPQWEDDPEMELYREKLGTYASSLDYRNAFYTLGWASGSAMEQALSGMECVTREGLMKAVRSLEDVRSDLLLPGITMDTGPDDAYPIETLQLQRFEDGRWHLFGDVIDTREGS
jgi:branched-chain amino acid transport system substrate-binding protein